MTQRLLKWLDQSPCSFLAVLTIETELKNAGFSFLDERDKWNLEKGGKYYVKKNGSAIFAFMLPDNFQPGESAVNIISAHSDSPCFYLKPNCEIYGEGGLVSLNVEKYGGGILYTWFDRPLSLSGRVFLKGGKGYRHFNIKRPIATIPHLAIHFNRKVNEGNSLSVQKDMKPVIGIFEKDKIEEAKAQGGFIKKLISDELGINPGDIIDFEGILSPAEEAALCGYSNEFIQSARIDDLSMAFAGLEAMLDVNGQSFNCVRMLAIFDNEETGSGTKQGAASPVLKNIIERIVANFGGDREEFFRTVAHTFMISADDAHAWHPNYNEKYDPTNHPYIGKGPVIKVNANGKYMTDSYGATRFIGLCEEAGVKYQTFVNHGDVAGGSTLGNILTSQLPINGVDVGNPIWAMHSARETGAVSDQEDMIKVFKAFWRE